MNAPTHTITQSPWIISNGLNLHGWSSTTQTTKSQDALHSLGLSDAFSALGIDTNYKHWVTVSDVHDKSKISYRATMWKYMNTFSRKERVIVARNNYGPDWFAARKGISKDEVPPLKHWSDVVFLEWLRLARVRTALRNVEHVFRYNIANQKTQDTLRLAMGNGDIANAPDIPREVSAMPCTSLGSMLLTIPVARNSMEHRPRQRKSRPHHQQLCRRGLFPRPAAGCEDHRSIQRLQLQNRAVGSMVPVLPH